jgi:hypothetical protein
MARSREITGLVATIVTLVSGMGVAQRPLCSVALSQEAAPLSTATTSANNAQTTQPGAPQKSQRADEDRKGDRQRTNRERERYQRRRHVLERPRAEEAKEHERPRTAEARRGEAHERHRGSLWRAYYYWSFIQLCNLGRQDYLTTYINDVELERARTASKAIERDAIAKDPKTNIDETFAQADTKARADFGTGLLQRNRCRHALNSLLSMSPVSPNRLRPGIALGDLSEPPFENSAKHR